MWEDLTGQVRGVKEKDGGSGQSTVNPSLTLTTTLVQELACGLEAMPRGGLRPLKALKVRKQVRERERDQIIQQRRREACSVCSADGLLCLARRSNSASLRIAGKMD